ncbi:MAG: DNA-3-methyladenine glycosylase [Nitrososphaerota archaeon]|nr:DNA-3-methyladenine glycosylase [Nitrososphaerota archaeon]MDG6942862.1 DNA-3-methyladenine glycosylase [Nitrososphaerota archaeon]MDG6950818.1 DNA-3-methyladenine glycosylase [Nitrososphaerota archaeon]
MIPREFFNRYTPEVARDLLGCRLVRMVGGKRLSGIVVETEAYRGPRDPASHAYRGKTPRNSVMFGPPGHAYVYFTMGMHYCLNVTTEPIGTPGAVLLRAIEPEEGIEVMVRNRGPVAVGRLASGPGNLTKALNIGKELDREDLVTSERVFLERGRVTGEVGTSPRVGVSAGRSSRWRFFEQSNPFVSRGRPSFPQNP